MIAIEQGRMIVIAAAGFTQKAARICVEFRVNSQTIKGLLGISKSEKRKTSALNKNLQRRAVASSRGALILNVKRTLSGRASFSKLGFDGLKQLLIYFSWYGGFGGVQTLEPVSSAS